MNKKAKENIKNWAISSQINNRPNKTSKGMTYTNERRARRTNNSFLYAGFVDKTKYKVSKITRTLCVRGTCDNLAISTANKLSLKRYKRKIKNKQKK